MTNLIIFKICLKKSFSIISMGHYAKRIKIKRKYFLSKGKDKNKDQTYFLRQLLMKNKFHLVFFPLANINKNKID